MQSAQTLCNDGRLSEVDAFWIGDVEAVVVGASSLPLVAQNLLARDLRFLAAIQRDPEPEALFPKGEIALVFRTTNDWGEEVRDTLNVSDGKVISIQGSNADFTDEELQDRSNPDVLIPAN